jgi:hypothetical protein
MAGGAPTLYLDTTNHRVGIGTSSPPVDLTVEHDASINSGTNLRILNGYSSGNRYINIAVAPDNGPSQISGNLNGRLEVTAGSQLMALLGTGVFVGPTTSGGPSCTGTVCDLDMTTTTGSTAHYVGYDNSGVFTGRHTSATTTLMRIIAGQSQGTTKLFEIDNNSGTAQTYVDQNYDVTITGQKATSGTRYVCIDTNGKLTSSASACSGS